MAEVYNEWDKVIDNRKWHFTIIKTDNHIWIDIESEGKRFPSYNILLGEHSAIYVDGSLEEFPALRQYIIQIFEKYSKLLPYV